MERHQNPQFKGKYGTVCAICKASVLQADKSQWSGKSFASYTMGHVTKCKKFTATSDVILVYMED